MIADSPNHPETRIEPLIAYGVPIGLWVYVYVEKVFFLLTGIRVYREYGLIENLTVLALLVAVVYLALSWVRIKTLWPIAWLTLLLVGAIYFAGEEISWGYHFFDYPLADHWARINDQGEPNLHNLTGEFEILFDKLPRQLLSIGVVAGGLLGWWADRKGGLEHIGVWRRMIPPGNTLLMAVIANLVSVPEKIW